MDSAPLVAPLALLDDASAALVEVCLAAFAEDFQAVSAETSLAGFAAALVEACLAGFAAALVDGLVGVVAFELSRC